MHYSRADFEEDSKGRLDANSRKFKQDEDAFRLNELRFIVIVLSVYF